MKSCKGCLQAYKAFRSRHDQVRKDLQDIGFIISHRAGWQEDASEP